jgi:hypothetical protein
MGSHHTGLANSSRTDPLPQPSPPLSASTLTKPLSSLPSPPKLQLLLTTFVLEQFLVLLGLQLPHRMLWFEVTPKAHGLEI